MRTLPARRRHLFHIHFLVQHAPHQSLHGMSRSERRALCLKFRLCAIKMEIYTHNMQLFILRRHICIRNTVTVKAFAIKIARAVPTVFLSPPYLHVALLVTNCKIIACSLCIYCCCRLIIMHMLFSSFIAYRAQFLCRHILWNHKKNCSGVHFFCRPVRRSGCRPPSLPSEAPSRKQPS